MSRRKTSRVRNGRNARSVELRVRTPRIVGFEMLRVAKRCARLGVVAVVVGLTMWGAKLGLRHLFIENAEFRLDYIDLQTDGGITEHDLATLTGIDPTASVFAINLESARKALESRPAIVKAKVSRRLPGTLRVRVEERTPVAWLECRSLGMIGRNPECGVLLDAAGTCFPCEEWLEEMATRLPVIVVQQAGEEDFVIGRKIQHRGARRGLHLVNLAARELEGESWSLPVVAVRNEFSLVAATSDGALVTFGMYDHRRQLADLRALRHHAAETGRLIGTVDLMPQRNIPVTFAATDGQPLQKSAPRRENRLEREMAAILNRG
ncbi:MAG: FtsQ-type POTRA domain-containing protein [Akkermansiaceae bacterium]|nr:FtsQ-type POTRA domain-containing protein [Akkermansiaceae bacterium]